MIFIDYKRKIIKNYLNIYDLIIIKMFRGKHGKMVTEECGERRYNIIIANHILKIN